MNRIEKIYCILFLLITIIWIPCFFVLVERRNSDIIFRVLISMGVLSLIFMILVIRDVYKRDFPNPYTRIKWLRRMFLLPPSMLVYLFVYAFKPRRKLPQDQTNHEEPEKARPG